MILANALACNCRRLGLIFSHVNWLILANLVLSLSIFIYVPMSLVIWSWYAW
ncbi:Tyrosine--tRNA ligase [Gossypium arboreum]|uniref:Tyrosine--tRNA ligase n=1 Tax=Gossypium arboreum TaxID=29729 RepID=A0A0B0NM19_GOSAR|nr:Tyrosine--tRNA ligase [Gossypium arboreum]